MYLLSTIAALTATVASVNAASAYIYNHCSFDAYLFPTDTTRGFPKTGTKIGSGSSWSEPYFTPQSGGVSLKLSKTDSCDKVTQFEYTLTSGAYSFIWYDISNIDCTNSDCPFYGQNLLLEASKQSCPQRSCAASDTICSGFYNKPDDDTATLSCDPTADVIFHLCYNNGTSAPAPASSAAPSKSAAPTSSKVHTMEAPVATTMYTVTKTHLAVRTAEAFEAHAHARRHLHHRV